MVRAGVRIKDAAFATLVLLVLGCGGSDGGVAPPPPTQPLHFTIDIRYVAPLAANEVGVFTAAAAKWTRALRNDIGGFPLNSAANACFIGQPTLNELHRNLLIFVSVEQVDGPQGVLAYTQVCAQSSANLLPIVSHIRLDRDDLASIESRGLLLSIVTHEMGHALGFNPQVYTNKGLVSGGVEDPHFIGLSARTEFVRRVPAYTGNAVPLEDVGQLGEQSSHWRWSAFGDELMIGTLLPGYTYPLSTVTLGLFKDIGYDVDMSVAEAYPVLSIRAAPNTADRVRLVNDVVAPRTSQILSPSNSP
jgi:hypothetical protein